MRASPKTLASPIEVPPKGLRPWKPKKLRMTYPSEHNEQKFLFQWAVRMTPKYPELAAMYAVPNGEKREAFLVQTKRGPQRVSLAGNRLKAEGVRAGVPDVHLPVARAGYHGLYVEMKSCDPKAKMSKDQEWWFTLLSELGYLCLCCHGWAKAAGVIEAYVRGDETRAGRVQWVTRAR